LLVDGKPAPVGARALDVLMALVERGERVVSKSDLLDLVWPDLVVEENNLQVQVSALRKILGPQAIATVPGRGYRFTAALDEAAGSDRTGANTGTAVSGPVVVTPATLQGNLPHELPPLYGRDADLVALHALVHTHRLVTVVGAGGIGKSRLAQATAQQLDSRWREGAWMVELAGLSDPALLPNAVAQVVGIKLSGQGPAVAELVAGLAQRSLLLVIDNCEHLLDAVADLVQALMYGAPLVTLLTTSQEPLRVADEQQYRLMPLAVPAEAAASGSRQFGAVTLFEARVRAANPRFELDGESLPLVIDICQRLDGLPLAIEFAAARVATLGLRPVRDKLDARFKLLTGGARSALRRHQTLRAALEWSHGLLDEDEQMLFRRLGVFAGGFTIELAQSVASDVDFDEWAVLDRLSALVDKSLVGAEPGETPRYRLLESARAYALEQLAAAGETTRLLTRHALAVRSFVERVDRANLDGELLTEQLEAQLIPELDNLRAAHAWVTGEGADPETAVVIASCASALEDFSVEAADWLRPLQEHVETGLMKPAVTARYWRAVTSGNMGGKLPLALRLQAGERAQALYKKLGDARRTFSSLTQLARHRMALGDQAGARAAAEEARGLVRPDWPGMLRIRLLRIDAYLARDAGRLDDALSLHREAVRVSVATGDWLLELIARGDLADLLWQIGPIEEAAREARGLMEDLRKRPANASDRSMWLANLTGILSEMGRIDEASAAAVEGLPVVRRTKRYPLEVWAHLLLRRGRLEASARLLGVSDGRRARAGEPLQSNEQRLIDRVRAELAGQLPPEALAVATAEGASLSDDELFALVSEALTQPQGPGRR
jgi:predicted ATPase/DNA-binding winged helix-turn-helix (wHTH) protein